MRDMEIKEKVLNLLVGLAVLVGIVGVVLLMLWLAPVSLFVIFGLAVLCVFYGVGALIRISWK